MCVAILSWGFGIHAAAGHDGGKKRRKPNGQWTGTVCGGYHGGKNFITTHANRHFEFFI